MSETKYSEIVSIEDINNGAIKDLFDREYKKLLKNLGDENTGWKPQREINIKLKVKLTSEARDNAVSSVEVSLKEAPPKPHEQVISLDFNGSQVSAYARKDPGQMELDESNVTEFKKEEVI